MKIVADSHIPYLPDYFGEQGELVLKPGRTIDSADVKDADVLLVRSVTHVDEALLGKSRVKFVGSITAGADHLDTDWLDKAGVIWRTAAGFNAPPVADYVLSVIAALQRKQVISSEEKLKVTIIGVGHVGRMVAQRLGLLNVEITLCDPLRAAQESGFASVALDEVADQDVVLLHVPLTRTGPYPTLHFIDKKFLLRQKPESVLINASRGAVINSDDLIEHGKHLYWCLDVWEHEPKINKALLERAFISSPHIAGYSVQSKMRGTKMIYELACKEGVIKESKDVPFAMPRQALGFAGTNHRWQDVVLGAYNPVLMTAMMRSMLLPSEEYGHLFDDMRVQFNYRHELAFVDLDPGCIADEDRELVSQLLQLSA